MVRIKFTNLVISPRYGNCAPGDIVSCDESFARHCVNDLGCAVYLDAFPAPAVADEVPQAQVNGAKPVLTRRGRRQ